MIPAPSAGPREKAFGPPRTRHKRLVLHSGWPQGRAGPEAPPKKRLAAPHRTLCGTLTLASRTLPGRPPANPRVAQTISPILHTLPLPAHILPWPSRSPRPRGGRRADLGGAALARPRQARRGRKRHGAARARLSPAAPRRVSGAAGAAGGSGGARPAPAPAPPGQPAPIGPERGRGGAGAGLRPRGRGGRDCGGSARPGQIPKWRREEWNECGNE